MEPFSQTEIDSAWTLWQALLDHLEALWARYEVPFSERMLRQQEGDEQDSPWMDFTEDDIPF